MSDTAPMGSSVERLQSAATGFRRLQQAVEAGAPWPLHDVEDGAGPESEWGPMEVLTHVTEMLPFWLGEIERILGGAPEPVPFGRTVADRLRVLTIERDRTLPARELFDRIDAAVERYARRLPELGTADLARRGSHRTLGELTVGTILERLVVGHAEGHVGQLAATLGPIAPVAATDGPPGG
jgi:hypothetical protein